MGTFSSQLEFSELVGAQTMDVSGFWVGEYSYNAPGMPKVSFQADLEQLGAILSGISTEQNTFDPEAGQILIAELFGKVSGNDVSFTKAYTNSALGKDKVRYAGFLSDDGTQIDGTWIIQGIWNGKFRMTRAKEQAPMSESYTTKKAELVNGS